MGFVIGRGRRGSETYPVAKEQPAPPAQPAFAFNQNSTAYTVIEGDAPLQIAVASISLSAGSRVLIEGLASFQGSVAAGSAGVTCLSAETAVVAAQSFDTATGSNQRTCNYLALTGPQPSGPLNIGLLIAVDGTPGARIDGFTTVLTLTEILAP